MLSLGKLLSGHQSLRTRLIIWFLLIALLPLGWTTVIFYQLCKHIVFNQAMHHLQDLSLRQGQILKYYFQEKETHNQILAQEISAPEALYLLEKALKNYEKDPLNYEKIESPIRLAFEFQAKILNYQNLFLVTKEGEVIFSLLPNPGFKTPLFTSHQYPIITQIFEETRHSLHTQMNSFILPAQRLFTSFIASPLFRHQEFIGVLIAQLDTSYIYQHLAAFNHLGLASQLIFIGQVDHQPFSIIPTESSLEEYPITWIDPESSFGGFIQKVLSDHQSIATVVDQQGQKSLMVGNQMEPSFNWAIVSQITQNRLLAPVYWLSRLSWMLAIFTAFTVILAASYVSRKLTTPILALTNKTKQLASGDLTQRIEVVSKDEIGRLGESFNEMAAQLDSMIKNLDSLVVQRTKELGLQNVKLEEMVHELRETQNRLVIQEKLASLGALTAGIAHEIKNPLNFINNFAELCTQIQHDFEEHMIHIQSLISEEEAKEMWGLLETLKLDVGKIYEYGKRADSIVRNMLEHSRAVPGEKRMTNLHMILDAYISLSYHGMRAQDPTFDVHIEKQYDPSLPFISVIPQEISQVFLNLLNNAYYSVHQKAKHAPESYIPTVKVPTENHQDSVVIKIWENGMGIAPEILPKLFTPFFTTKPPGEGTGLGLSLSYHIIVQGHGGTLTATSQEGEYAEFTITLPLS